MIFQFIIISHILTSFGLNDVRETYFQAIEDEKKTDLLITYTKDSKNSIDAAYLGVAYTLKASFTFNPLSKLDYFEKGKNLIESSVKKSPENIEIRFLRLTVQEGSPSFLKYKDNIISDKEMIKKNIKLSSLPSWYKKKMHEYLNKR